MVTDQIADLLTRIRNALDANHPSVKVPASSAKRNIIELLVSEGYVASYETIDEGNNKSSFKVMLRYDQRGAPVIKEIKRMSSPGRRWYVNKEEIPRNRGGLGTVVVSTSKGLLTDAQAREQGIGGEVICSVF